MTTKARVNPKSATKRRLIAIDCETNGRFGPNVRILTLAMVELRNGIAFSSKLWSFHPGRVPMDPGALAVNGLTPELLDGANSFGDHVDELLEWLSAPRGTRVTLVGHKVAFDARQLAGEFARLGLELPRFELIDTAALAEAAGVRPSGQSLDALLDVTSVANSAPHTALGDTLATGEAALVMMKRATSRGADLPALLDRLDAPYKGVEAQPTRSKPTIKLSPEHAKAHLADLADGRRRRRALDVCVAEECRILAARMEDGLINEVHSRQVVEWALDYLANYELSQQVVGQLLMCLGRALRRIEDPDFVLATYREHLAPLLPLFEPCGHKLISRCYSCQERSGPCELTVILRDCVHGFLDKSSAAGARPDHEHVEQFLPGYDPRMNRNRGRPAKGFYGELRRNGHLDAAGYGAYLVAEVRRTEGGRAWAHTVLNKAWRDGCRTPQLTELLASMVVVDGLVDGAPPADPKDPLRAALGYIAECQSAYPGQHGQIFARLAKRGTRLAAQLDAEPRAPRDPDKALNRREPHRTLPAEPLANAAIPVKFERKRRGRPPKV